MIPQETIERVAAASDIADVIGSYVPLKRAGSMYKALCPFHKEKSPSFTVNPGRQMFKCFGCGAGGSVFKFVTMFTNIDFPSAVRMLAEKAGIPVVEDRESEEDRGIGQMRRRLWALHAEAAEWFHRTLMKSPDAQHAREYLKERGLSAEVAARWKIGYAPKGWDFCLRLAGERGYRREEIAQSGLVTVKEENGGRGGIYDRFRDRLMFPISDESGKVIGFSGRVLSADAFGGKYVNSPESPIFTKGKVLFGLNMSKKAVIAENVAIVCEGQIDLITAFEAGVENVVAPQGTAFTETQARLIKRHADEVILCFDSDAAGRAAAEKSVPLLLGANVSIRVLSLPPGEDPDSLIRTRGPEAFQSRIKEAKDFFDFQIETQAEHYDLTIPRGKAQFSRKMAESVALLTDTVLREAVVGKVSARLGMSADDFRALLRRRPAPKTRDGQPADLRADGAGKVEANEEAAADFEQPPRDISTLLKVALEADEARRWLVAQPWEEVLHQIGGGELLGKVLMADFDVADSTARAAFLGTLPSAAEEFLTGLMMERPYTQPLAVARGWWGGVERKLLGARQTELEARLRLPGLSPDETTALQKEVLDLEVRLKEIARL